MSILATIQETEKSLHIPNPIFNFYYLKKNHELVQLKEAILLAKSMDEDVLFFSKSAQSVPSITFEEISGIVVDLASNNIMMLFVDVNSGDNIMFNKYLEFIDDITLVNSFFVTSPLYPIILALIDHKEDYQCDSLLKLLKLVNPYNFKLSTGENFRIIQQKINVISPFRNASAYLPEFLDSISQQRYSNFKVYLIDDHSDVPYDINNRINEKINLTVNEDRKFALQNIIDNLMDSDYSDEDIICFVDADDILLHNHVFAILNAVYSTNIHINLTYGSMTYLNRAIIRKVGSKYSQEEFDSLRHSPWRVAHLRSFKFKLFKKLLSSDAPLSCLRDDDGNFFKMPYDMAILFPLMELAGHDGVKFLNTPLYGYRLHENNDHVKYRNIQYESEMKIRGKPSVKLINAEF